MKFRDDGTRRMTFYQLLVLIVFVGLLLPWLLLLGVPATGAFLRWLAT